MQQRSSEQAVASAENDRAERETLPGAIGLDATSALPRSDQRAAVLECVLAYLALPYSVAEHGCGKKTSMILSELRRLGLPLHALGRGMVVEADLSPAALAQFDADAREHALVVDNPIGKRGELQDERLRRYLEWTGSARHVDEHELLAGPYLLHHDERVQFAIARSHVFTIVTFWNAEAGHAEQWVVDPTLRRDGWIALGEIRTLTRASEALLFEAPPCGSFRLHEEQLTARQRRLVATRLGTLEALAGLDAASHAELVRDMLGAERGSIGDPERWTYANNVSGLQLVGADEQHDETQRSETGLGDPLRELRRRLLHARATSHAAGVDAVRDELRAAEAHAGLAAIVERDARWSEQHLEPLAELAIAFRAWRSLTHLAEAVRVRRPLREFVDGARAHRSLRGFGVRQRRRIDRLGMLSLDEGGAVDARALRPGFVRAAVETVRQMNAAGLTVCVDRVGNLHGLPLDQQQAERLRNGRTSPSELLGGAVVFLSHIDTVADAGRFDGRLGVTGGIECAQTLAELRRWFDVELVPSGRSVPFAVTACNGEEMTFTGRGVSMPGSAAVAGSASVADVHAMVDADGRRFGDLLLPMLARLAAEQEAGSIELANDLVGRSGDDLVAACHDPSGFFSPSTYERHIEQGPVLDRAGVPAALVGTIMGIRQEDYTIRGERAEAAAFELALRMRELAVDRAFAGARATVGVLEACGDLSLHDTPALRCVLEGEQNHAGATATDDRRDPAVAAGRLLRFAAERARELAGHDGLLVVGDVELVPGNARNVIPAAAHLTVAWPDYGALSNDDLDDLLHALRGFASGELSRVVPRGGEGLGGSRVERTSFVNVAAEVRASLDLRAADPATIARFAERVGIECRDLERTFGVTITRTVEQELAPQHLERSGQVLLVERSFGGSHNPAENELTVDLTRGCILQLATLAELASRRGDSPVDLVATVDGLLPARWKERLPRYVSGALHDTCNIAARAHRTGTDP